MKRKAAKEFEIGQKVILVSDILRWHSENEPPSVFFEKGQRGIVVGRSTSLPNYWYVYWGEELPDDPNDITTAFPVYWTRLEEYDEQV